LFQFKVSGNCHVTIAGNSARGNVVLESTEEANDVTYTGCDIVKTVDCYTGPDVSEWEAVGKPDSWCYPRQCHGDADGIENSFGRGNLAWVSTEDVAILVQGFRAVYSGSPDLDGPDADSDPDTWIAADFDHTNNTFGRGNLARVSTEDVAILVANFRTAPVDPNCLD
jgi:hypothetical protein